MADRPTIAELRAVTQPPAVRGRRNSEHWTADLYQRRLSPYLTRVLLGTALTANAVTVLMIVTGAAAGAALLVPGLVGAVLAAFLGQLQMLWDCCDGEVARWRQTFSPAGVFLDKLGHTTAESTIPLALGVRADGGFGSPSGWTTLGALLAVLVLVNKSLNDAVHVARASTGLPRLEDKAESVRPHGAGLRRARSLARFVPFHRAFHSVEMTLLALVAAVADVLLDGTLPGTRFLVVALLVAAAVTVVGHLAAILLVEPAAVSPTVGAVVLSMGTRPTELAAALDSLLRQRDVELDVVLVGNGWAPTGLPAGVRTVQLPENVGIPEGRNVGARAVRGEVLFFYDDDAYLPTDDVLARLAAVLAEHPDVAAVQPRPVDPDGRPAATRWVPRPGSRGPLRPGVVTWVWEGTFAIRRRVFEQVGGWPGHFVYGHEGIDLMWKVWDAGYVGWYAPDIVVNHPATSPARHAVYFRNNARNRVWVVRRNLPWPLAGLHLLIWTLLTVVRLRDRRALRTWFAGFREGLGPGAGARVPMRWRTVWRLTRAGRPPIL